MSDHPSYEVFIADPVPQDVIELVPNGDERMFSPLSITLVSGDRDAVLVDPPMTIAQTAAVGDWVESTGKNLTHIFVTHGHGDHWFGSAELAERFGAEVVNTAGTIEHMHANLAIREFFWMPSSRARSPRPRLSRRRCPTTRSSSRDTRSR